MSNLTVNGDFSYNGGGLVPIGTILAYVTNIKVPDNYLLCNGSEFNTNNYPELYALLGSNILPNLTDDRYLRGSGTPNQYQDAGLPNIKGSITRKRGDLGEANNNFYYSGAISAYIGGGQGMSNLDWSGVQRTSTIDFNANTYSSIYRDDINTVQPKNYSVCYIIRAK